MEPALYIFLPSSDRRTYILLRIYTKDLESIAPKKVRVICDDCLQVILCNDCLIFQVPNDATLCSLGVSLITFIFLMLLIAFIKIEHK